MSNALPFGYGLLETQQMDAFRYMADGVLRIMTKKDYEKLALAVRRMTDGFRVALSADGGATTEQLREIAIAQIALVLANDNPQFDSFMFEAVCKGRRG